MTCCLHATAADLHLASCQLSTMVQPSDEQRFPSLDEFNGWYNLGYERPDGIRVLHSRKDVPEFEHGEFYHMYLEESAWFEQLLPESALKPYDPADDPPIFVRSDADDRTLEIYPDFDYVTLDLIRRIQTEFLGRRAFWRVMLMAYNSACTIVIYPEAVRFGNLPLCVPPEEAIREILPGALKAQEALLSPSRPLVNFLRSRLPDAVREIGDRLCLVMGVLDNNAGDYDRLALLLLARGARRYSLRIKGTPRSRKGLISTGTSFNVDPDGRFIKDDRNSDPAFKVTVWHPRADFRGPLTITDRETGESSVFELTSECITHLEPDK